MKTTKEILEEHDKHCGCNEVHTNPETFDEGDTRCMPDIPKGCEFCGTKENCNNYYLGRKDTIDEMSKKIIKEFHKIQIIGLSGIINKIAKEMKEQ